MSREVSALRVESDRLSAKLESDAAIEINTALLKCVPADPVAINRLGIGLLKRGQADAALKVLENGLRANPRNTIMLRRMEEARKAVARRAVAPTPRASPGDARIIALSQCVPEGRWTTYGTISEIVFGHRNGARTVGSVLRAEGFEDSAHRTLRAGGTVSELWQGAQLHGVGRGADECIARLRAEDSWDERRGRARPDRFIDADELRRRETARFDLPGSARR